MSGRLVCIGSVNIDYTYELPHIVRPGETLAAAAYHRHWGGKGLNQSLALARAGADAYLAARVSRDDFPALDALCAQNGLDLSLCQACDVPTGNAIIQVDPKGQNCIFTSAGANATLDSGFIQSVLNACSPGDLLLLQNEVNGVSDMIRAARARGLTIALNPSPISDGMQNWPLCDVDLLILNEVEGEALTGRSDMDGILDALSVRCPNTRLVLTLGSQGARYRYGAESYTQPIFPVETVDTTAAGDTFTGYFLSAFARNSTDIPGALSIAAKAASIAVSRRGASDSIPFYCEVEHFCQTLLHA